MQRNKFRQRLKKYKNELAIKNRIDEALKDTFTKNEIAYNEQTSILNPCHNTNINVNLDRLNHKNDLIFLHKRIADYYESKKNFTKKDSHGVTNVFDKRVLKNLRSLSDNKGGVLKDINEVIDVDTNDRIREKRCEEIGNFVYSNIFQYFLALVVFLNTFFIAIQTDNDIKERFQVEFTYFDHFANAVFIIELLLKWYYGFTVYWQNRWNLFDFVLILVSCLSILFVNENKQNVSTASRIFRTFRVFRALRSLRSISMFYRLQIIVNTLRKSILNMGFIIKLILLFMIMLSIFSLKLFGSVVNKSFDNIGSAVYTLFILTTRENLSEIFEYVSGDFAALWRIFIALAIILLAFILANLSVAVVVTNMEQAFKDQDITLKDVRKKKQIDEKRELNTETDAIDNLINEKHKIIKLNQLSSDFPWEIQVHIQNSILQDLDIIQFQNYCLTLESIEANMKEYRELSNQLDNIVDSVKNLTEKQIKIKKTIHDVLTNKKLISEFENILELDMQKGTDVDLFGNLIDLEKISILSQELINKNG